MMPSLLPQNACEQLVNCLTALNSIVQYYSVTSKVMRNLQLVKKSPLHDGV